MIAHFKSKEHKFLSNFYPVKIIMKGIEYPSVENAYMAAKSNDLEWKQYCANPNSNPVEIKKKSRTLELRKDWDVIKISVMKYCLREKFNQEPFKTLLLETGDQNIQEGNWWGDKFWGVDLKQNPNIGENHLGRLLMKIRKEI